MPDFSSWYDLLGTGIQSLFAWTTFNRDAFADNVGWRQNQKYQQKNYHLSWVSIARDDIRDMMSISVNRLNNFMIVNGLILGVAGSAITSANFDSKVPAFLVAAFLVCIATAVVFLVLAIMFGIKGQNCAFTNTMKLLTWEVRPENPADYNHDYMNQAQWIEKMGLDQMFRIPGLLPNYQTDPRLHEHLLPEHVKKMKDAKKGAYADTAKRGQHSHHDGGPSSGKKFPGAEYVAEDFTALEHLEVSSTSLWYLTKFGYFMRLWMPYDTYCKYAMGMGMLALGHAGAYFSMGTILSGGWEVPWYAGVCASFSFVYMVALVIQQNFKEMSWFMKWTVTALMCLGPTLGVGAAAIERGEMDLLVKYMWIVCFLCHFLFWCATFFGTYSPKVLRPSRLGQVGTQGGFWGAHQEQQYAKHDKAQKRQMRPPPGEPTVVGNGLRPVSKGKEYEDWSDYEGSDHDSDLSSPSHSPRADIQGRADTYRHGGDSAASASASSSAAAATSSRDRGNDNGAVIGMRDSGMAGHGKWPTDDDRFESKVESTKNSVRSSLQQTIVVICLVWVALLIWAATQFFIVDEESPVYRSYAHETALPVKWNNPFFRPTMISCAESDNQVQFLADDYRVFRLVGLDVTDGEKLQDACNLTSRIRDLASYCDGSCWPVILTDDNHIVDCQDGTATKLLQDSRQALLMTVYPSSSSTNKSLRHQNLIISPGEGKMVMYSWSSSRRGWIPEHELTSAGSSPVPPVAISVSGNMLVMFYGVTADHLAVSRRDLSQMAPVGGPWALSSSAAPLQGGCAFDQARKAMVLPKLKTQYSSSTVIRLDLERTHGAFTT